MVTPKPTRCQSCGRVAETAFVTFNQNIGMLVLRRSKTRSGNMCKACIQETFAEYSLITLFLGWWGMISAVIAPIFLIGNFVNFTKSFSLAYPAGAVLPPQKLTKALMDKIEPYTPEIITRLKAQEPLEQVAKDIASKASVVPEVVKLYVSELARISRKCQQERQSV